MSLRIALIASAGVMLAAVTPAASSTFSFTMAQNGASNTLSLSNSDNVLTFSSSAGPGTFTVANTGIYSTFTYALGDYSSFSGDPLTITFAKPVTAVSLTFGLEDLFGLFGSDFLSETTNTGLSRTFSAPLNASSFEPEGYSTLTSSTPFTSLTITSSNPFAISSVSVPEPAALPLFGFGLLALIGLRRRT